MDNATPLQNITHQTPPPPAPLVCFGVTMMASSDPLKHLANKNVAAMYATLPGVVGFLCTVGDVGVDVWLAAGHAPDTVLNRTETNAHGTPFFRSVMQQLEERCDPRTPFVAYANADILFDDGLPTTLRAAVEHNFSADAGVLLTGRRVNYQLQRGEYIPIEDVAAKRGELFIDVAQDYFIYSRRAWPDRPEYVVGRPAYDNALVDHAFHNLALVDCTLTVTALHQTAGDGNFAGHTRRPDTDHNKELPGVAYDHGSTGHARWETRRDQGYVQMIRRP